MHKRAFTLPLITIMPAFLVLTSAHSFFDADPWAIFDDMERMHQQMMENMRSSHQRMLVNMRSMWDPSQDDGWTSVTITAPQITIQEEDNAVVISATIPLQEGASLDELKKKASRITKGQLTVPIPHGQITVQADPLTYGTQLTYWVDQKISQTVTEERQPDTTTAKPSRMRKRDHEDESEVDAPATTSVTQTSFSSSQGLRSSTVDADLKLEEVKVSYHKKGNELQVTITIPKDLKSQKVIIPDFIDDEEPAAAA